MTIQKQISVSFDADEYAYLEWLADFREVSLDYLLGRAVRRIYLTEKAKKHHQFVSEMRNTEIDWGADWPEIKEQMALERGQEIVNPNSVKAESETD